MSRIPRLLAALALLALIAGCTIAGSGTGGPRCDRNGDEEQRIACVR